MDSRQKTVAPMFERPETYGCFQENQSQEYVQMTSFGRQGLTAPDRPSNVFTRPINVSGIEISRSLLRIAQSAISWHVNCLRHCAPPSEDRGENGIFP